jgi:hypothetical protein
MTGAKLLFVFNTLYIVGDAAHLASLPITRCETLISTNSNVLFVVDAISEWEVVNKHVH